MSRELKNILLNIILFSCLVFCFLGVLSAYIIWWIEISKMTYTVKKNCTDTTCFVQVVDGNCFAKFTSLNDPTLHPVECDKHREGEYNTTLPCNIKKGSNVPVLRCINHTSKDDHLLAIVLITIFGPLILLAILLIIGTAINFFIIELLKPNGSNDSSSSDDSSISNNSSSIDDSNSDNTTKNTNITAETVNCDDVNNFTQKTGDVGPAEDTPAVASDLYPHLVMD